LRPVARQLLKARRLRVVDRGYVEQRSIWARLERLCVGLDCNETQLRQLMLVELWLRNRAKDGVAEQVRRAA